MLYYSHTQFGNMPRTSQQALIDRERLEAGIGSLIDQPIESEITTDDVILDGDTDNRTFVSKRFSKLYIDWPNTPSKEDKYKMIRVYVSKDFSDDQQDVIFDGFDRLLDTVLTKKWNDQISQIDDFTHPGQGLPWSAATGGALDFWTSFAGAITNYKPPHWPGNTQAPAVRWRPIYVNRMDEDGGSASVWTLGRANNETYWQSRNFTMDINATAIDKFTKELHTWAGLMMHEMLHNLGWSHASSGCKSDDGSKAFMCQVQQITKKLAKE